MDEVLQPGIRLARALRSRETGRRLPSGAAALPSVFDCNRSRCAVRKLDLPGNQPVMRFSGATPTVAGLRTFASRPATGRALSGYEKPVTDLSPPCAGSPPQDLRPPGKPSRPGAAWLGQGFALERKYWVTNQLNYGNNLLI